MIKQATDSTGSDQKLEKYLFCLYSQFICQEEETN